MSLDNIMDCCKHTNKSKKCKRKGDNKFFSLPRRFTKKQCQKGIKGFTMRSSCAPYKGCQRGGKKNIHAISVLHKNPYNIDGTIVFNQVKGGVRIKYNITGLKNGKHGFHIHEFGDLTDGCKSAGAHFNPLNKNHGGLTSKERHLGDLGNIQTVKNITKGSLFAKDISLDNKMNSILGRMIVIHSDEDDLGNGGDEESLKTGNAGKRLACGVIGLKK